MEPRQFLQPLLPTYRRDVTKLSLRLGNVERDLDRAGGIFLKAERPAYPSAADPELTVPDPRHDFQ